MANKESWFEPASDKARQEAEDCGRLIEIVRGEEGWTRTQLAEATNVSAAEVENFEHGHVSPIEPLFTNFLRAMGRTS